MQLEERVASGLRAHTDLLHPVGQDPAVIRSLAKAQARRRASIAVAGCAVVAIVAALAAITMRPGERLSDDVGPVAPVSPSPDPSSLGPALDTSSWETYASERYGFTVGHPADWTREPAVRNWRPDIDAGDFLSRTHEAFRSPEGDVRVSVWNAPLEESVRMESTEDILQWVEDYCEGSGSTPCTGIADRAVELCLERRDCHPGLLVPFDGDVAAFFSGGIYDPEAMTVVTVWRPEDARSVRPYGGARRLLEGFLSTMQVWPAATPDAQRR